MFEFGIPQMYILFWNYQILMCFLKMSLVKQLLVYMIYIFSTDFLLHKNATTAIIAAAAASNSR